ncbi:50S ribosome-binding GTPase [bacterium BD-1]|nr:50S ribosome-binding GTPase [Ottowia caeni]
MSEVESAANEDHSINGSIESIEKFTAALTPEQRSAIERRIRKLRNYSPRIGVFGKTGAGKSSLCNALFGSEKSAVSNSASCTRELVELRLGEEENRIILVDAPGICEDTTHHEYVELYREQLPKLDLVFWVIGVTDRALAPDLDFYRTHIQSKEGMPPVVFVLNQSDIAAPQGWDETHRAPSKEQRETIDARKSLIGEKFNVPPERVVAVSAEKGYGLISLVNRAVDLLPKEKMLPFVDRVAPEQVSSEALAKAEKGFFDSAIEVVKNVLGLVKEHKETIKLIASGVAWLIKTLKKSQ